MLLIKNVQIHDAINPNPYKGDILVENGKIAQIAADIAAPEGAEVVDASGLRAYPGFIDAHSHIGLDGSGIGSVRTAYHEMGDVV